MSQNHNAHPGRKNRLTRSAAATALAIAVLAACGSERSSAPASTGVKVTVSTETPQPTIPEQTTPSTTLADPVETTTTSTPEIDLNQQIIATTKSDAIYIAGKVNEQFANPGVGVSAGGSQDTEGNTEDIAMKSALRSDGTYDIYGSVMSYTNPVDGKFDPEQSHLVSVRITRSQSPDYFSSPESQIMESVMFVTNGSDWVVERQNVGEGKPHIYSTEAMLGAGNGKVQPLTPEIEAGILAYGQGMLVAMNDAVGPPPPVSA